MAACRRVAEAAVTSSREIIVERVPDATVQTRSRDTNSKPFEERPRKLTRTATPRDSVVIYTHSQGTQGRGQGAEYQGGLVLDQPTSSYREILSWDNYAKLIVDIPAKNVVVLTMACFSGKLVNSLNAPGLKERWENRRQKEGRNLIVLTAQKAVLLSGPVVTNSEIINPFTFAVFKMFAGEADGFSLANGEPGKKNGKQDGKLTAGEMVDYVLHTAANVTSEYAELRNTAKPQMTGSFDRTDVLSFGTSQTSQKNHQATANERDGKSQFVVATSFLLNDADGDGQVTREEAHPVVARVFGEFDRDGDGGADREEFAVTLSSRRQSAITRPRFSTLNRPKSCWASVY